LIIAFFTGKQNIFAQFLKYVNLLPALIRL